MSDRKNYNSIVFLTTLSVYLSLVLVGGVAPSVLAQAATTRGFDIKSEIVVEDDLDKKPDDENNDFSSSLANYFNDVGSFITELQKLHEINGFDLNTDRFAINRQSSTACNVDGDPTARSTSISKSFGNYPFESAVTAAGSFFDGWSGLSNCLPDERTEKAFSNRSELKLFYDNAELRIEISAPKLTKQKAEFLAERFIQAASIYKPDEAKPVVKILHEHTFFRSENNQVFIVTRLPRAALDSLLAEK
jgi:hypothetical protein